MILRLLQPWRNPWTLLLIRPASPFGCGGLREAVSIKEIPNFKETSFFDISSAQPADFRKSDKLSKKYRKNNITPENS